MRQQQGDMETNFHVRSRDADMSLEKFRSHPRTQLSIILDNLRSAFNVGAIFRTCDTLRVACLYLCGYTAYPPHRKLEKTSLGTIDFVPWKHEDNAEELVVKLRNEGRVVWAAETTSVSKPYNQVPYPPGLAVVFGNEALGVSREVLSVCDDMIEIPTLGFKNSLNVASSVAVIGYRALECFQRKARSEQRKNPTKKRGMSFFPGQMPGEYVREVFPD